MATPFDRLMETIRPHLPGAIDDAIRLELFLVCQDFFRRSDTWREDIAVTLRAGEKVADLMPYVGRVERLLYVVNKDGIGVRGAIMPDFETIQFPFEANQLETYTATVSITVSDPVSRDAFPIVPYEIVQRYTDELIAGILAKMMAQPAKPYTNLSLAQFYNSRYRGGTARARNEKNTGNTMGSQRWAFPQTFQNRRS
jgi:hypothetical protein